MRDGVRLWGQGPRVGRSKPPSTYPRGAEASGEAGGPGEGRARVPVHASAGSTPVPLPADHRNVRRGRHGEGWAGRPAARTGCREPGRGLESAPRAR